MSADTEWTEADWVSNTPDPEREEAEWLGWENAEMARLSEHLKHLAKGKTISSRELAKVLRATLNAEIPRNVRLVVADLLDPKTKTGRARRVAYFENVHVIFRDNTIRVEYKALLDQGVDSVTAMEQIGMRHHLGFETVRTIVNSKQKS